MAQGIAAVRAALAVVGIVLVTLQCAIAPTAAQEDPADTTAVGTGKVLDLTPKVLDVTPTVLDIVGVSRGVEATLADLGAKVTQTEIKIDLSGDVLFDFDKDTLRPDALPTLQKVGAIVANYPKAPILIEGHTDSMGKHDYNMKLSDRRANSVKKWLVANAAVDAGRIKTKGWGETKPAVPNTKPDGTDDPDGRQKNRRVEITIKTK